MEDEIIIDGIDVTSYRLNWKFNSIWERAIDTLSIELSASVRDIISLRTGLSIQIKRGYVSATEEYVFNGQITSTKPLYSTIVLTCKNRMYDAIKNAQSKSWEKDVDTSAGVGSEIFKEICDNCALSYTPALSTLTDGSIHYTGGTDALKITKFIQNDEDDFDRLSEIADIYNWIISYDYANDRVNFKPKGYASYPVALNVGTEIPVQIKWEEDMEQLLNKVKVNGATVYDKIVETFTGAASSFTLSSTPEDTEVRINHTTTDDLQTRGQKGVGTIGTDFDYYIDVERKLLVFSANVSNVWINYGAQVPLPVIAKNQTSIDKYGGPNKIPHYKQFTFPEIKDLEDAKKKANEILAKYSNPFILAKKVPVSTDTLQTNGVINVGTMVNIIDSFSNRNVNVFVSEVEKSWPHVHDRITIGDQTWKTETWQANQMRNINKIFNQLNKNQDILYQTIDLTREVSFERRSMQLETTTGSVVYLGQGDKTYKEVLYDTDYFDSSTSSSGVVVNTTAKKLLIPEGDTYYSLTIEKNTYRNDYIFSYASLTNTNSNTIKYEITGDNLTWEEFTPGVKGYFSTPSTDIRIRITNEAP